MRACASAMCLENMNTLRWAGGRWPDQNPSDTFVCFILHPFQIIGRLIFSTLNLTTRLIKKFVQNITFVVACFINMSSSRMI